MYRKGIRTLIIGPLPIKICEDKVNKICADGTIRVKSVVYTVVSENFVHPEQSYIMGVITYKYPFMDRLFRGKPATKIG